MRILRRILNIGLPLSGIVMIFALLISRLSMIFKKPHIFWIPLIFVTILALTTSSLNHRVIIINDKLLHILSFVYLTFAYIWINPCYISPYYIMLYLFLYGLFIEGVQSFLPSRTCSMVDIIANGVGCILGFALARFLHCIHKRQVDTVAAGPENPHHEKVANISNKNDTELWQS
jgi:VanZ family protein